MAKIIHPLSDNNFDPPWFKGYLEPAKGLKNHKYGLGQPVDADVADATKTTSLSDSVALFKNDVIYFLKDVPDADYVPDAD